MYRVMNCARVAVVGLFIAANVSQAFAGAVLEQSADNVLVNQGHGYVKAASGSYIPSGARLKVSDKRAGKGGLSQEAVLRFDEGCSMTLSAGQVLTVGEGPCSFAKSLQAMDPAVQAADLRQAPGAPVYVAPPPSGFDPTYLIVGAVVVAAGIGIAVAVNNNDDKKIFVSP